MPFEKGSFIVRNDDNPDYVKSSRERFRIRWLIAGDYEIKGGILLPKPMTGWRDSYPAVDEDLPVELAKIEEGDEQALLAFVRTHGMLGVVNLLPTFPFSLQTKKLVTEKDMLAQPLPGMKLPDQQRYARRFIREEKKEVSKYCNWLGLTDEKMRRAWLSSGGGDPLPWIWAHIRTLKICLELSDFISLRCEEGVEEYLRQFQSPGRPCPTLNVALLHKIVSQSWEKPDDKREEAEQWTNLDFAKYIRRYLINENIDGVRQAIEPVGRSEDSFFQYRALIEMAYWHLHNRVMDGKLRRCKECRKFFVRRDKREKFCPEPKTHGQSICGINFRARLWMRKKRQEERKKRKGKK